MTRLDVRILQIHDDVKLALKRRDYAHAARIHGTINGMLAELRGGTRRRSRAGDRWRLREDRLRLCKAFKFPKFPREEDEARDRYCYRHG
jgi:hypothetical protein